MHFDEEISSFIKLRNIVIKDDSHALCVKMFTPYFYSFSGDKRKLALLIEKILDMPLDNVEIITGCYNGVFDGDIKVKPFNVDLYIKLSNDIKIYIYIIIDLKDLEKLNETYDIANNEHRVIIYDSKILNEVKSSIDMNRTITIPIEMFNRV